MASKRMLSCVFWAASFLSGSAFARDVGPLEQVRSAPLNPEFVAWEQRTAAGRIGVLSPETSWSGHIPSPVDRSHLRLAGGITAQAAPPSSYDLRPKYVTSVKDQGQCGACWAFATYGSLESWLLKNKGESLDFSENHLKTHIGFDLAPCAGGNADQSTAYLVRWDGPAAESDDPYRDTNDLSSAQGQVRKHVLSVLTFVQRDGNRDEIKNAVMTYGALMASLHWDWSLYRADTKTFYYSGDADTNHDVDIVGWDDNKSVPGAPGKGAWLVKSSWGTDFGDGGYAYVSYYDTKMAREATAFCNAVPTSTYTTNYYYDTLGHCSSIGLKAGQDYAWAANVFTAKAEENLVAVGFYALSENTAYEISIYDTVTVVNEKSVGFLNARAPVTSGTARYSGYHTIDLSSPVPLHQGDRFIIAVKCRTPDHEYPLALELPDKQLHSSQARANPGESYISSNGIIFQDLTTVPRYEQANVCIRGLTVAGGALAPSGPVSTKAQGSIVCWGSNAFKQATAPAGNDFVALAAGSFYSLALRADGSIVGWGKNEHGQATPPAGHDFVALAAGNYHSLALKADGTIVGWGGNDYGESTPPEGNDFIAIAAGDCYSLALRADHSMVGWGNDSKGQATALPGKSYTAIAAGRVQSAALRDTGTIEVWGTTGWVPTGDGWMTFYGRSPTTRDFIALGVGNTHGLGLRADGSVEVWGYIDTFPPTAKGFTAIAVGNEHDLALQADGSIVGWSRNDYGQANPPAGTGFIAIAAGRDHSVAIKAQ